MPVYISVFFLNKVSVFEVNTLNRVLLGLHYTNKRLRTPDHHSCPRFWGPSPNFPQSKRWRILLYEMCLYAVALKFSITGTKRLKRVSAIQCPCALFIKLEWRDWNGLQRDMNSTVVNTTGINWNAECIPGQIVQFWNKMFWPCLTNGNTSVVVLANLRQQYRLNNSRQQNQPAFLLLTS